MRKFRGLILGDTSDYTEWIEGGLHFDVEDSEYLITVRDRNDRFLSYLPCQESIEEFVDNKWVKLRL